MKSSKLVCRDLNKINYYYYIIGLTLSKKEILFYYTNTF
jgi:hypothetical protein